MKSVVLFVSMFFSGSAVFAQIPDFGIPGFGETPVDVVSETDIELKPDQVGRLRGEQCSYVVSTRKIDGDSSLLAKLLGVNTFVLDVKSALCDDILIKVSDSAIKLVRPVKRGDKLTIPGFSVTEVVAQKLAEYKKERNVNKIIEENNFVMGGVAMPNTNYIYKYCHTDRTCFGDMLRATEKYINPNGALSSDDVVERSYKATQQASSIK